jgi:hypothetical protein
MTYQLCEEAVLVVTHFAHPQAGETEALYAFSDKDLG